MKENKDTSIKSCESTVKELKYLKVFWDKKNLNEVIKELIDRQGRLVVKEKR